MKSFLLKHAQWIGLGLGAGLGWAYWHFVGCADGSCPIRSIWYMSTGYGALMGWLLVTALPLHSKPKP
jgi:hypothetical protein